MEYYLTYAEGVPPLVTWQPSIAHATLFRTRDDAERHKKLIIDAQGIREHSVGWIVYK